MERSECAVDIEDRGYQFGDGVYEVIRIYNGSLYTLDEHIARFFKSAAEIGIVLPFSEAELKGELKGLIKANQVDDGGFICRRQEERLRESISINQGSPLR